MICYVSEKLRGFGMCSTFKMIKTASMVPWHYHPTAALRNSKLFLWYRLLFDKQPSRATNSSTYNNETHSIHYKKLQLHGHCVAILRSGQIRNRIEICAIASSIYTGSVEPYHKELGRLSIGLYSLVQTFDFTTEGFVVPIFLCWSRFSLRWQPYALYYRFKIFPGNPENCSSGTELIID